VNEHPIDPRLAGAAPPEPPERLRAAALAAAEGAWDERPDLWTRLWESRRLRIAWAAAVLALVASHAGISIADRRAAARAHTAAAPTRSPERLPAVVGSPALPELGEVADVLRLRITRIQWTGEASPPRALARPVSPPPSDKEPS
jgi:hypothetical protein